MQKIVQKENPVLHKTADSISTEEIKTPRIQNILMDMQNALKEQADGVALAAPQIGESLRIFIISEKVFSDKKTDSVFINPELISISESLEEMHEGCLSVRGWYGNVNRHLHSTVKAYDEKGNQFTLEGSGLLAQVFQHEIDHLNGILFVDKATKLEEITIDEASEIRQKNR